MAEAVVREFTKQELAFFHEISKEKYQFDLKAHREEAWEWGHTEGWAVGLKEGKAEGEAAGEAQKALEIARKMKEMGDPVERIQIITGLSPEIVEKL